MFGPSDASFSLASGGAIGLAATIGHRDVAWVSPGPATCTVHSVRSYFSYGVGVVGQPCSSSILIDNCEFEKSL